jgi:predicted Rossmann-fold nucleotide-binding protein
MLEILTVIQLLQVRHMENKPLILVGNMWHDIMNYSSNRMWREHFISDEEQFFHWNAMTPIEAAERLLKAT